MMKASAMNKPDERLVYLALRSVFSGENAKIRSVKATGKQIKKYHQKEDVKALLNNHNHEQVVNTARELLEAQIFESTINAKIRFPEIFSVSPAQSADREHSEEEAARSEANALKNAAEGRLEGFGPNASDCETVNQCRKPSKTMSQPPQQPSISLPSLYPIYLPFETQHRLMQQVQNILEKCCYTFAENSLSDVLVENGWDCPERVELNVWCRTFQKTHLLHENIQESDKPFKDLLESVQHIRHTSVHRIVVSVNRVLEFLLDSESFAAFLQDDKAAARIARQRGALEVAIDEIKRNKEFLNFRATTTIKDLDKRILELKHLQEQAVHEMLREDEVFRRLAVANLEIAIDVGESKQKYQDGWRDGNHTETEDNIESFSDVGNESEKQLLLIQGSASGKSYERERPNMCINL